LRERERRREPADAAARYQYFLHGISFIS